MHIIFLRFRASLRLRFGCRRKHLRIVLRFRATLRPDVDDDDEEEEEEEEEDDEDDDEDDELMLNVLRCHLTY